MSPRYFPPGTSLTLPLSLFPPPPHRKESGSFPPPPFQKKNPDETLLPLVGFQKSGTSSFLRFLSPEWRMVPLFPSPPPFSYLLLESKEKFAPSHDARSGKGLPPLPRFFSPSSNIYGRGRSLPLPPENAGN